ncbi:universal stress protein [Massilia yuzhufengensis]|uniref:Universal stress protein family protein n=1 Tax=Massilia yuzhufengensis TaxID=1164594 RepID=A0A1I1R3K5_9BURK|nr:universal stress protein [Massilia yuzhufengensis]SFD28879.1 Universal stress protein family protein [Massilia yuzhufengensis]
MYKTILVHVDGSSRQDSRLRAAVRLATEDDAHLIGSAATGISWMDFAVLAGSAGAPVQAVDLGALRDAALLRLQAFSEQAGRLGVASHEARLIEDAAGYGLLLQSRYADLVVLSQDSDDDPGPPPPVRRLPEMLALNGTRPVLVVPASYADEPIPGTVVAGWDGRVPALRALDAALPLLQRATTVKLVTINPYPQSGLHGEEPGADMGLYLARHGVAVEVVAERTSATVGSTLAGMARDCGAGLMVCGAYGHSRFHEWMLGGATRELLERAPVPLLIAH